ncbi:MAG: phytanoyl-CoA dioxygenase family protein [Chloroflexi bacterium]|nr:phytanoyl-CoA dioxygenase family protein [Chloroflexota bacterium]
MNKIQSAILTPEAAIQKRNQLMDDGFCVVPGILQGELLERVRSFTYDFLNTHATDPKHRYQGSDFHIQAERTWAQHQDPSRYHAPLVDEILDLPEALAACAELGLEGLTDTGSLIVLSKPPHGPALYWHQDSMDWNHPKSSLPWPSTLFLSYYLVDTTRQNGCLRVIPGTHRKRIDLHGMLPDAHGPEIQAADETHEAFMVHPDEIDIPVKAGDLVIADGRVLHAAWPNNSDQPRPLILAWWRVFPFPSVPSWWTGEVPPAIQADPDAPYERTRKPGQYLR